MFPPPLLPHPCLLDGGISDYLDNIVSGMVPNGVSTADRFYFQESLEEILSQKWSQSLWKQSRARLNLNMKIHLCTEVSSIWLCMCYYNFKDYLVYFLQGNPPIL